MKVLFVANCGFGDVSWATSWPRIWSEKGHEVDVFLMEHTGNPFHANPFINKMFVEDKMEAKEKIGAVIENGLYDIVLIPDNTCDGIKEVIEVTKDIKNVSLFKGASKSQFVSGIEIPVVTKPEWYFTKEEFKYVEEFKGAILFHPLCSDVHEKSRNIDFNLIIKCSERLEDVVVVYGGRKFLPIDDLKRMEASGIRLLWEDYNCFNDESGSALGKFIALTSLCRASVHAWSGSATLSMGYNKPYVMVVPGKKIRANGGSPYLQTSTLYKQSIHRARSYGCLEPSAWCVTTDVEIIVEAVNNVLTGKTWTFDQIWTSI